MAEFDGNGKIASPVVGKLMFNYGDKLRMMLALGV